MRVDQAHMMPETVQSLTITDKEVCMQMCCLVFAA